MGGFNSPFLCVYGDFCVSFLILISFPDTYCQLHVSQEACHPHFSQKVLISHLVHHLSSVLNALQIYFFLEVSIRVPYAAIHLIRVPAQKLTAIRIPLIRTLSLNPVLQQILPPLSPTCIINLNTFHCLHLFKSLAVASDLFPSVCSPCLQPVLNQQKIGSRFVKSIISLTETLW